ncbi:hypothetical protein J437_LFUL017868 [Ladona fulva]|uniref:Uncharacterized protein n=1 Tax=Ladona fulva TaxID=123851 RepID=A0A8K0KST0_LADFU|nr:hypothetical protein J437_LFUL017868 [Ladona fulva]
MEFRDGTIHRKTANEGGKEFQTKISRMSSVAVEAVVGRSVALPCDIEPLEKEDRVYMVLWFREAAGKPMYRSVTCSLNTSLSSST